MESNNNQPVSSFSLFKPSKDAFMRNLKTFAIVLGPSAIYQLYLFVTDLANPEQVESTTDSSTMFLVFVVGFLVIVPLLILVSALSTKLQLEAAKGKTVSFGELWKSTKSRILPFFVLSLTVGLYVLGGLILFIVPGIFMLKKYIMSSYIFLEDDSVSVSDAMKKSAELSGKPSGSYIWGVLGVSLLLSMVGFFPVFGSLIAFVLTSLYSVAMPLRYLELKKLK